jgi:UDP-N-acetylglucosamine 2-epimerase (non-hydrolysing)
VTSQQTKVMFIYGTRPETIKLAPVIKELNNDNNFHTIVTVTGQHRQMLDQAMAVFGLQADYDLNVMQENQTLPGLSQRILAGLSDIFADCRPDIVLVQGDTTSVLIGALSAFYHGVKVGHVEAGLRTADKRNPFPEEINRRLAGVIADLHFAPTAAARGNLVREGIDPSTIFITGNSQIDALLSVVDPNLNLPAEVAPRPGRRTILMTTHRRENLDGALTEIYRAVKKALVDFPDVDVIFPMHLNPKVRSVVMEELQLSDRVRLLDPFDYRTMANVMARSYLVLTDSGGLQEEAPSLGVPVLVTRTNTERPEGIAAGTARLAGTTEAGVSAALNELLGNADTYRRMSQAVNPYGDGKASFRIRKALRYSLGLDQSKPEEYI